MSCQATEEIKKLSGDLASNRENADGAYWVEITKRSSELLNKYIRKEPAEIANQAWFLNKIATVNSIYVSAFGKIKNENYYEAWCDLEQAEIGLLAFHNNKFLDPSNHRMSELDAQIREWQKVFPYKIFASPEIIYRKSECSICRTVVSPWSKCNHKKGHVYFGEECSHIVTESEFLGMALVKNPVQKYSVPMSRDDKGETIDHYDYSIVKFIAERVMSPFHWWTASWTHALHPHERYTHLRKTDACPCESGKSYEACCLREAGVVRPHLHVDFSVHPPTSLPRFAFAGDPTQSKTKEAGS